MLRRDGTFAVGTGPTVLACAESSSLRGVAIGVDDERGFVELGFESLPVR